MYKRILAVMSILLVGVVISYAQQEKIELELPESIFLYSPETGKEDIMYIDEPLAYIEGTEPEGGSFADNDEEENSLFDNVDRGIQTYSSKEDATQITDRRIVYLALTRKDGKKGSCSGAMVGDYVVLTAAHCLRDISKITAYAGKKGASLHAEEDRVYYSGLHTGYAPLDEEADWGIIVLKEPLGRTTGTFGASAPVLYTTDKISIVGFPYSLKADRPWLSKGKVLPKATGALAVTVTGAFNHSAWLQEGMSGGPIFEGWGTRSDIIGVNATVKRVGVDLYYTGSGLGVIPALVNEVRNYKPSGKTHHSKSKNGQRHRK